MLVSVEPRGVGSMRIVRRLIVPLFIFFVGWYGGARWSAPDWYVASIDGGVARIADFAAAKIGWERHPDRAKETAAADDNETPSSPSNNNEQITDASSAPSNSIEPSLSADADESRVVAVVEDGITICPMKVSNPPRTDKSGMVANSDQTATLNGVDLLIAPVTNACLSSGYGHRGYAPHRGVDYYSDNGGDVLASADGVIREATYRDDYGNMIVIDHGGGVFTRYAHLGSFSNAVREGVGVKRGQRLGPIGSTGSTSAPHLHFEIRTGDYSSQAGSFGLDPVDPYSL